MNGQKQCFVCQYTDAKMLHREDYGNYIKYDCPRCGHYWVSRLCKEYGTEIKDKSAELSGWLRERKLFDRGPVLIIRTSLEEAEKAAIRERIGNDMSILSIDDIIKDLPNYGPLEKQRKLLKAIELLIDDPGIPVFLDTKNDISLAWSKSSLEFIYYIKSLEKRGFLSYISRGLSEFDIMIETAGWEYLEQHQTDLALKTQGFVAMSFNEDLRPVYDNAIAPAIQSTGYRPCRVDSEPHIERIDAKIISEIKEDSRFIVADATEQNPGVYYEAGFAHGLSIPVIWCVREDDLKNVHFDVRQYRYIVWETEDKLKKELEATILATIERGPIKDDS